jgi:cytochrome c553
MSAALPIGAVLAGLVAVLLTAAPAAAADVDVEGLNKVFTCSACHGAGGNSRSASMPILAGMEPAYFKKQIESYAAGRRPSPEMEPYAKYVLQVGVDEVSAYFARQRRERTPVALEAAAVARGRTAAAPCVVCHGPAGKGDPAKLIPSIAGQAPGYLREQMLLFKQDRRNPGDPQLKALKALMATMPDESFADLAAYYASLAP